jgi:hypothetical protein
MSTTILDLSIHPDAAVQSLKLAGTRIEELAPVFTSRAEYLDWRARWRAAYAEYTTAIRAQRAILRSTTSLEISHRYAQRFKSVLRAQARRLLELRAESKTLAASQWAARRAAAEVAA